MASRRRVKVKEVHPIAPRCAQGKLGFETRSDAKRFIRSRNLLGNRPYDCPQPDCSLVHIGHLPLVVIRGEVARCDMRPRSVPRIPTERRVLGFTERKA